MTESWKSRWGRLSPDEWAKLGAYSNPFSGCGLELLPLGAKAEEVDIVLHEVGYMFRPHWNYPNVFSPFWRLYCDLRPGHEVVFPDKRVTLGPDRLVLIPDHQLFHTLGTEPQPKFWCTFSCASRLAAGQVIPVELPVTATEKKLIRDIVELFKGSDPDRRRIYHYGLSLLHLALSRPEIRWRTEPLPGLAPAIRHIEENYGSVLYVEDLAKMAGMSERDFRRKFRALQGVSPSRFIQEVRVRQAAHLLAGGTRDMSQIAESTGLPSAAYMSRVFKQITGHSPAEFRRISRRTLHEG